MSNQGTLAEYVYSELQVIDSDDEADGHHVVAVRLNLGPIAPSKVLILSTRDAAALYQDLGRVLLEYGEATGQQGDGGPPRPDAG